MFNIPHCPVCSYDFTYWEVMKKEVPFRKFRCPVCSTDLKDREGSAVWRYIVPLFPPVIAYLAVDLKLFLVLMTVYACVIILLGPFSIKLEEKE